MGGDHNAVVETINSLQFVTHLSVRNKGFWDHNPTKAEKIALLHAELSEMLEAARENEIPQSAKIPEFTAEEEEAADVLIRLLDYCGGFNLRLAEAFIAKSRYNQTRPYRHNKAF